MVWDWNVARVRVNRESCMALLDNGAQINTIMPGFIDNHSLDVGPLSNLVGGWVTCISLGNALTHPMGYVVIWAQENGVQGYDKDQIALVIPDLSNFVTQVPVILGTPTISHIMNLIKEMEIDTLATTWVNPQVANLLAVRWATTTVEDDKVAAGVLDLSEYNKLVSTKDTEMIDAFSSHIIHVRMRTAYTGAKVKCDDSGPMCWRWVITPWSDDTECLHWDVQWQQECCCCSEK